MTDGPDFSSVTSREAAEELCQVGALEQLFLLPTIFGGEDVPPNVVFVPRGVGAVKHRIDEEVIAPMVRAGEVTDYSATPEYEGSSMVPIAIRIVASGLGTFSETVKVWGRVLDT